MTAGSSGLHDRDGLGQPEERQVSLPAAAGSLALARAWRGPARPGFTVLVVLAAAAAPEVLAVPEQFPGA